MKTKILVFTVLVMGAVVGTQAQTISAKSNPVKVTYSTIPDVAPPIITWVSPTQATTQSEEAKATVKVGLSSPHAALKIKTVSLFINGRAVNANTTASSDPKFEKEVEKELELTAGPNEIKVIAENDRGEKTMESRLIHVTLPVPQALTYADLGMNELPKYYALIIGISDYKNSDPQDLPNLAKPVQDATNLYNLLLSKYSFTPENTTLLKNPTQADILDKFYELASTVTEKDNVLIFYAGHGFYDQVNDLGFWLASDAKPKSPGSWIQNSSIKDYVARIKSRHTLLITDACFGGSIFNATRAVSAATISNKIAQFRAAYTPKSRRAITSGNLTVVPDESYFIKYLIEKLEENDEVFLPSQILFSRMLEPISVSTPTTPKQGIILYAGDEGGDFVFFKKMQ